MRCTKFCPNILRFLFSKCCKHSTVHRFFASERREITTRFSDMIPNLANTLQLQMSALHCCKIVSDGKAPRNELMLHQNQAVYRCQLQNAANVTQRRDSNSKPMTKILSTDAFTQRSIHKDMFLHKRLHIHVRLPRDGFTHKHLHAGVLHRGAFTQKLLHTNARVPLNTDAFTLRSC